MALKDYQKYYPSLTGLVPNTVSRNDHTGERALTTVVVQSGRMVLDSDLLLSQDVLKWEMDSLRRWQSPSGWLRAVTLYDAINDYTTTTAPNGVTDLSGASIIQSPSLTMINGFILPKLTAMVAGRPVTVEYTNTDTPGYNLIALQAPTVYDGTNSTVKRTDFVFLEVWYALVAPSPIASGSVTIAVNSSLSAGDIVSINGHSMTATTTTPVGDQFLIGANEALTALNLANALNASATFNGTISASANSTVVTLNAVQPGFAGNSITLSVTVVHAGSMLVSGATLTGGDNRPNKPQSQQGTLYRHGNVQSPSTTWLPDEILDPNVGVETTQRVQVQYRIRTTGASEAVNYKTHPEGFANSVGKIYAQGTMGAPVASYPFVPADKTSTWMNSSAVAYGIEDNGLWVAGDGSSTAAQALGTVDGYVYAIPICFVHRHNNASDPLAAVKGFDPQSNTNGAPTWSHVQYTGNLGVIAANKSDRPDGQFCDVIDLTNILDLRRHVVLSGLKEQQELRYQIQSLMDGALRSWSVDTADKQTMGNASGDVSPRFLVCDEIGRSTGDGNPSSTRGVFVRSFDHVARRFGAQSVIERLVVSFYPGDRTTGASAPGVSNPGKYVTKFGGSNANQWCEGDQLHLDLTQFDASSTGGVWDGESWTSSATGVGTPTVAHFAPPGTVITDVLSAWHDDGTYNTAISQAVQLGLVEGLGTQHIQVNLDANPTQANGGLAGFATNTITISGAVLSGDTVTINGQVMTAGTTSGANLFNDSAVFVASSLSSAINATSGLGGVTSPSTSANVVNLSSTSNTVVISVPAGITDSGSWVGASSPYTRTLTVTGAVATSATVTINGQNIVAGSSQGANAFYASGSSNVMNSVAANLSTNIGFTTGTGVTATYVTDVITVTATTRGVAGEVAITTSSAGVTVGSWNLPAVVTYNLVDPASTPSATASARRIFLELEITYPCGNAGKTGLGTGTTCSPDVPVTPDATIYAGTASSGQAPWIGPSVVANATAKPGDTEVPQQPNFRYGYREIQIEYVANNGTPGTAVTDTLVSRDRTSLYLPRRVFGNKTLTVTDTGGGGVAMTVNGAITEYGSSSRKVGLTSNLSGAGQSLCTVTYFPQDPIPNYGVLGNGFQLAVYYRSNAPQTAGVMAGALGTAAGGIMPTTLNVEPLSLSPEVWTCQIGGGSQDRGFPYTSPTDQIPIQDHGAGTREWVFCGTASLSIADFDTNTGLLALHPFVQMDTQNTLQFGSAAQPPVADSDLRAFYPYAPTWVYRPAIMSQPLYGVSQHKVFFPFLARIVQTVNGSDGGTLFRKDEVVLVVLSRTATLDNDNSVRFATSNSTTVASIYRTRNLLLVAGDTYTPVPAGP